MSDKNETEYDVVIVGGGIAGALIAYEAVQKKLKVLVLEAGDGSASTWEGYQSYVDTFATNMIKTPNSPYPDNPQAPSPSALDIQKIEPGTPDTKGYFVQNGPLPFSSNYNRNLGGTTLHWMGTCYRMCPADFKMKKLYDVGVDWPMSYDDLSPYYGRAEYEIGVAGEVSLAEHNGITFPEGYEFPMHRLPASYSDEKIAEKIDGTTIDYDGEDYPMKVVPIPVGRNSIPNQKANGGKGYQPVGAVGAPDQGLRCEGNSSCTPICPVQAKYSAMKTLMKAKQKGAEVVTQAVVNRVNFDEYDEQVTGISYQVWGNGSDPQDFTAKGKVYVLATHAIENAKIMLASNAPNKSKQIGRNLMDHPYLLTWGRAKEHLGTFRGPGYTSGICDLADGGFRKGRAAFRVDIGNWGWNFAEGTPYKTVGDYIGKEKMTGRALREKLFDETQREVRLGFMVEQLPSEDNTVTIDDRYRDSFGNHRPIIDYNVDDYTRAGFEAASQLTEHIFGATDVESRTHYDSKAASYLKYKDVGYAFFGSGHIVGTHRMGEDDCRSVVDADQKCHEHDNLYMAGCGSMPTIATSNPTLTMAALCLKTADAICARLCD